MCLCSALLCRTGLSHSSIRKFLYICLCRAWRNFRLVYRLVYHLGIRSRHVGYCSRLVRLRREYSGTDGDPFTGEADHRLFQRRYHESAGHHHYFDHGNAAALGNERKCEAEQYPSICKTGSDPAVHNPCSKARGSIELHAISAIWLERCIFRRGQRSAKKYAKGYHRFSCHCYDPVYHRNTDADRCRQVLCIFRSSSPGSPCAQ